MTVSATRRRALFAAPALLGIAALAPAMLRSGAAFAATGDEYVKLTLEGGTFLLKTSEMAETKAQSPLLKEFAQLEIGEQKAVAAVLKSTGVEPPAGVDGEEKVAMDKLMELEGEAFDKAYLEAQIAGHREALAIQQEMAAMTEITVLVTVAKLGEESIKSHLAMLDMISKQMM